MLRSEPEPATANASLPALLTRVSCTQAKLNGLGGKGQPRLGDYGVLRGFEKNYDLAVKISTAWSSLLSESDILLVTANVGAVGTDELLQVGLTLTVECLHLAYEYCMNTEVNGARTLLNPTTGEAYSLPCYDQDDYWWMAYLLDLSAQANLFDKIVNFKFVFIDEGADSPKIALERAKQLTRDGGTTIAIFDHCQRGYDWLYASPSALADFIADAEYHVDMKTYRPALNLWEHMQQCADKFEMGIMIEPMSDRSATCTSTELASLSHHCSKPSALCTALAATASLQPTPP